jgi:DHA2 family multidrug resistance protein
METLRYLTETFYQFTGDRTDAKQKALQWVDNLRQQQAAGLAYFDVFWVCAVLGLLLVLLVPFMKRSVAERGAHVGGE